MAVTTTRKLEQRDVPALVDLSLRAWAPVSASLRAQLGDPIFLRLHPDGPPDRRRRYGKR